LVWYVHWKKLFSAALVIVALGIAKCCGAEAQGFIIRIRSGGDSIYVDASGSHSLELPMTSTEAKSMLLLNYSSLYIKPRLLRVHAKFSVSFPPTPQAQPFTLTINATSSQVGGAEATALEVAFKTPNGTARLVLAGSSSFVDVVLKTSLSGKLELDKGLLPQELQAQLPMLVAMLQQVRPEDLNKQLAMAGVGWLRVESLSVRLNELGASFEIPFSASIEVDYIGYALTYNMSLDTVKSYVQVVKSVNSSTVFTLGITQEAIEAVFNATYHAENLEEVVKSITMFNMEVLLKSMTYAMPVFSPLTPQTTRVQQPYVGAAEALQYYLGLAPLPSNSTAVIRVEVGSLAISIDVKNLRLTHRDGTEKAVGAVMAFADALKSFGIGVNVESEVPYDEGYRKTLAEANARLIETLLGGYTGITSTLPLASTPLGKTATVTVVKTLPTTLTTIVIAIRTVAVGTTSTILATVTEQNYIATVAIGAVLLAIGIAIGYLIKKR